MKRICIAFAFAWLCFGSNVFAAENTPYVNINNPHYRDTSAPCAGLEQLAKLSFFDGAKWQKDLEMMTLLIKGLEQDGLVTPGKPYKLSIKENNLYINDKKQAAEVSDKFRKYFTSKNYTIIND